MTDYRVLCAELADAARVVKEYVSEPCSTYGLDEALAAVDAALSQPEPVGPTDEELHQIFWWECDYQHKMDEKAFRVAARAVLARWGRPAITPIPVSERLPEAGKKVIAHYVNNFGNSRTVCAEWVPAKSRTDDCLVDDDFAEYDEENDEYYWPEGWYESIENWDEYGAVFINDVVTHWQPLPNGPASALPLPEEVAV